MLQQHMRLTLECVTAYGKPPSQRPRRRGSIFEDGALENTVPANPALVAAAAAGGVGLVTALTYS